MKKISQLNCAYCDTKPNIQDKFMKNHNLFRNTIDRIDSTKGYSIDNCVAACWKCNKMKLDYTIDEFESWIIKVYNNFIKKDEPETINFQSDQNSKQPYSNTSSPMPEIE